MSNPREEDPSKPLSVARPSTPPSTFISPRDRRPELEIARRSTPDPFYHDRIGWFGMSSMLVLSLRTNGPEVPTVFVRVRFALTAENPELGALNLREQFEGTAATERGMRIGHVSMLTVACQDVLARPEPALMVPTTPIVIGGHACKSMLPLLRALEQALRTTEPHQTTFRLILAPTGSIEPFRIERGGY